MLIGIISDTHDDTGSIKEAVKLLNNSQVALVLHAGDITSPFTFEFFNELSCGFAGIFGNNDGDKLLLRERSGNSIFNYPLFMTHGGKKIVIVHEPDLVDALADSGHFDIVIYGHTHIPDIRRVGKTLVVNPGKAARLHKGESTLALIDTNKTEALILNIP